MRYRALLGCLLALILIPTANGQVAIDASAITPQTNGVYFTTTYRAAAFEPAAAILEAAGPDQVFDFTTLTFTPTPFSQVVQSSAVGTPGEADATLGTANHVTVTGGVVHSYYVISNEQRSYLGFTTLTDVNGDGVPDTTYGRNVPMNLEWEFPVAYGDSWSTTFEEITSSPAGETRQTITDEVEVDAWGELRTPTGSADAIRVVRTRTHSSPIVTTVITNYAYVTNDGLIATIAESDGVIALVQYNQNGAPSTRAEGASRTAFRVDAPYPNPVIAAGTIPFTLETAGSVRLRVFDVLGREVASLADGVLQAGYHERTFSGSSLANGLYLIRLEAEGGVSTAHVIVRR